MKLGIIHLSDTHFRNEFFDQDPTISSDPDVVEECTNEQHSFLAFRNELEGNEILVHDDHLLRIHRIRDENTIVQINVLNSAWMSQIDERPGSIVFPTENYREHLKKPNGFSISILHHPLGCFTTENSRQLRIELTVCSSIVLFGHEHIVDNTRLLTDLGDHVRIVDGMASPHYLDGIQQTPLTEYQLDKETARRTLVREAR